MNLDKDIHTDQWFTSLVRDLTGHGRLGECLHSDCQKHKQCRN